jgi:hypothetical protein
MNKNQIFRSKNHKALFACFMKEFFHIFCMPFKFKIIVATSKIPKSRFFCQSSPTMQLLSGMTSRPRRAFWLIVFLRSTLRKETTIPGYNRDLWFIQGVSIVPLNWWFLGVLQRRLVRNYWRLSLQWERYDIWPAIAFVRVTVEEWIVWHGLLLALDNNEEINPYISHCKENLQ